MSEVIASSLPGVRVAVLSGPSFALEVAKGSPTAVVIAAADAALAADLQEQFAAPNFRLYSNDDVLGVELAGSMKNVIAIAAGTVPGNLGLGANTLAALITRGLAEMSRLAAALGARPETLSGLAGLGDLVLTCNGALSRNRHVGVELAKGRPVSEILAGMAGVAEGVDTATPLLALAREHKVELPITATSRSDPARHPECARRDPRDHGAASKEGVGAKIGTRRLRPRENRPLCRSLIQKVLASSRLRLRSTLVRPVQLHIRIACTSVRAIPTSRFPKLVAGICPP